MSEMDDSCAVCAEALEWTAYGSCGHRDVCATCVARVRFVLQDPRCCICKTTCPSVFVTKAMGDYTRIISDFSVFPTDPAEGRNGQYWYHADTQAYFDDAEQYKMVRAMCRLSCSLCDRAEQDDVAPKRGNKFHNIGHLKKHLGERHSRYMCNLCLEGRKVFICEQKLYTHSQLNQHIRTGDSEVDGSGDGFTGHPACEFCKKPFYGENELYMHLSQDHFTCHICQRLNPGHFDYFRNYDDLEMHFRQEHFLCEDEVCLEKKFVVFQTESELKAHQFREHGGHASRSQRNAACQIPTSFRFRSIEQEGRRGSGRGRRRFRSDSINDELSLSTYPGQLSSETGLSSHGASGSTRDHALSSGDSLLQNQSSRTDVILEPSYFPPLVDQDLADLHVPPLEQSSLQSLSEQEQFRYAQVLGQGSTGVRLGEELFPPLPTMSSKGAATQQGLHSLGKSTLAARIRQKTAKVVHSARPLLSDSAGLAPSTSSTSSKVWPKPDRGPVYSASISQPQAPISKDTVVSKPQSSNSAWNSADSSRMKHSTSAPDLANGGSINSTASIMPSFAGASKMPSTSTTLPTDEDVRAANRSLVERIKAALGNDEDKYSSFKSVSAEYRQGKMNASEYLSCVEQFGLSHLVLELASLLPDGQRQRELVDIYLANMHIIAHEDDATNSLVGSRESKQKKKGKGKAIVTESTTKKVCAEENFLDVVRRLQSTQIANEESEVLSKDGYRSAKGKAPVSSAEFPSLVGSATANKPRPNTIEDIALSDEGGTTTKQKKQPKFIRSRLGDIASSSNVTPQRSEKEMSKVPEGLQAGLPARGAWRNGGGQRLFQPTKK